MKLQVSLITSSIALIISVSSCVDYRECSKQTREKVLHHIGERNFEKAHEKMVIMHRDSCPFSHELLGIYYAKTGQYKKSDSILTLGYSRFPENERIVWELAITSSMQGNYEEAMQYAQELLDFQNPPKASTYLIIGAIYDLQEDYEQALNMYQKTIETDSSIYTPYYNIGLYYWGFYEFRHALPYFKKALKLHDSGIDIHDIHRKLGDCYFEIEKYKEAMDHYEKAI